MVPLTWAMSRALRYNPTNPVHYIACQLIRWKYNNADPLEMSETLDFVIEATSKKDKILVVIFSINYSMDHNKNPMNKLQFKRSAYDTVQISSIFLYF